MDIELRMKVEEVLQDKKLKLKVILENIIKIL